jgi:lysophospholipase L1-like esterase
LLFVGTILFASLPSFAAEKERAGQVGRMVIVGDSLSAGFQNFSLFDSDTSPIPFAGGQKHGYAALVAAQAGASVTLPLISYPGIPPALALTSGGIVRAMGVGARENPANQTFNLSVPGFTVANALAYAFPGSPATNAIDAMSDSVLAEGTGACGPFPIGTSLYVSEVACAAQLNPQTILVSIGDNDALQALTLGLPPTNTGTFAQQYAILLAGLVATRAHVVVSNIPDVTAIPFLVPVPVFENVVCPGVMLPSTVTNADFVVLDITNPAPPTPLSICTNFAVRTAALIAQTQAAVTQFNQIIATDAKLLGAGLVDVNSLFKTLSANGYTLGNNKHLTTGFLGGLFSLDGIHPTNTGYAILANETIETMNTKFNMKIPLVSVDTVASTDPLILP